MEDQKKKGVQISATEGFHVLPESFVELSFPARRTFVGLPWRHKLASRRSSSCPLPLESMPAHLAKSPPRPDPSCESQDRVGHRCGPLPLGSGSRPRPTSGVVLHDVDSTSRRGMRRGRGA